MKLRARLALTTGALIVPLGALLAWGDGKSRTRAASDLLASDARASLPQDARALCEGAPEAWTRSFQGAPEAPHPGSFRVHLYPFDAALRPSVPWAPPLDPELARAARGGEVEVRRRTDDPRIAHEEVLLRSPWATGPCAWVLAVRPLPRAAPLPFFAWRPWLATLFAVMLAILLVHGPMVARIRELAASIRASSSRHYTGRIRVTGDDEIADLAAAFDEAARALRTHVEAQERRERTLRDFLANTTHDVMTPLTVLQGHLAAMRDAAPEGAPIDRPALDAATGEAVYMASLVHNLGVAARLEAGEPYFVRTKVDLGRLVERCVARHRPIARQHDVELACAVPEGSVELAGDETFLEQALGNLVLNAIRHNRAGGHVAVVVSEPSIDAFQVRVIDDGPGMTDDVMAMLARPAADSDRPAVRARRPDGHGLGLDITRRVAELHGLKLTFARAEGGGLCVELQGSRVRTR